VPAYELALMTACQAGHGSRRRADHDLHARAGADVEPQPFRPVLRGVLLTGRGQQWMRGPDDTGEGAAARHAGRGHASARQQTPATCGAAPGNGDRPLRYGVR
jgi:hypothetical protein